MKVRATKLGYDGLCRRKPGDVFELKESAKFSKKWMEKLDDDGRTARPRVPAPAPEQPVVSDDVI